MISSDSSSLAVSVFLSIRAGATLLQVKGTVTGRFLAPEAGEISEGCGMTIDADA